MEVVKGKNEALLAARGTSCLQEKQNNMSLMAEGGDQDYHSIPSCSSSTDTQVIKLVCVLCKKSPFIMGNAPTVFHSISKEKKMCG